MENTKEPIYLEQFKLHKEVSVFKSKYVGSFSKNDFILRSNQNEKLYFYKSFKTENSLDIYLQCEEFKSIDTQVYSLLESILNKSLNKISKSSWVYIQKPEFKLEWMHTHEFLESTNRTNLRTQWTYVFYIQIPENLPSGEGDLIFLTEDGTKHTFVPKEKDILIFPGDLSHIAMPCPSAKVDRIVYASNLNLDSTFRNTKNKKIRFEEYF